MSILAEYFKKCAVCEYKFSSKEHFCSYVLNDLYIPALECFNVIFNVDSTAKYQHKFIVVNPNSIAFIVIRVIFFRWETSGFRTWNIVPDIGWRGCGKFHPTVAKKLLSPRKRGCIPGRYSPFVSPPDFINPIKPLSCRYWAIIYSVGNDLIAFSLLMWKQVGIMRRLGGLRFSFVVSANMQKISGVTILLEGCFGYGLG